MLFEPSNHALLLKIKEKTHGRHVFHQHSTFFLGERRATYFFTVLQYRRSYSVIELIDTTESFSLDKAVSEALKLNRYPPLTVLKEFGY